VRLNVEVSIVPSPVVRVSDSIRVALSWISGTRTVIASRDTANIDEGEICVTAFGTLGTLGTTDTLGTTGSSDSLRAARTVPALRATGTTSSVPAVLAWSTARAFHFADLRHLLRERLLS